jgi:hypothetical protein
VPLKREHLFTNVLIDNYISVISEFTVKDTIRINIEGVKVQKYMFHQANMIYYSVDMKSDDSPGYGFPIQTTSTSESFNNFPH